MFEISTIRREDFDFIKDGSGKFVDVLQCNNAASSRTPRGHQGRNSIGEKFIPSADSGLFEVPINIFQLLRNIILSLYSLFPNFLVLQYPIDFKLPLSFLRPSCKWSLAWTSICAARRSQSSTPTLMWLGLMDRCQDLPLAPLSSLLPCTSPIEEHHF